MILTVTLNPSVDRTLFVEKLTPFDTNRVVHAETDAGGKGVNLSRVVAELGGETLALGFLGGGPGAFVRSVLDVQGVHHGFIEVPGETRINVSVEEEDHQHPPTVFNERGPKIEPEHWEKLIEKCKATAPRATWACLGGSIPPGLPKDAFLTLGKLFKEAGCKLAIDADGEPMRIALQAKPDLIKPNMSEAERLLGHPLRTLAQTVDSVREFCRAGIEYPIISRGKAGAVLGTKERIYIAHSPEVRARSTIGSGDSMIAGFLWALTSGKSPAEAFAWANAAGAATATTNGAEIAQRPVILELLNQVRMEVAPVDVAG